MPIEIRELVIRAEVNTKPETFGSVNTNEEFRNELKQEVINACMHQIKEYIRQSNQR